MMVVLFVLTFIREQWLDVNGKKEKKGRSAYFEDFLADFLDFFFFLVSSWSESDLDEDLDADEDADALDELETFRFFSVHFELIWNMKEMN